jgi:hypothetical protein
VPVLLPGQRDRISLAARRQHADHRAAQAIGKAIETKPRRRAKASMRLPSRAVLSLADPDGTALDAEVARFLAWLAETRTTPAAVIAAQ